MQANTAQQPNSHGSMLSINSSFGTTPSGKTLEWLSPPL